jgi:hypothetical protein
MHLSAVGPILSDANSKGEHPVILTGAKVGLLGSTGTTQKNNLHFEVRVGTICSLQYQLKNPKSSCSMGYGFDPQVNPLLLFKNTVGSFSIVKSISNNQDFNILYTAPKTSLYLNRIEFRLLNKSTNAKIKSHVLDFNTRQGFNSSNTISLDRQDKTNPYIEPNIFNSLTTEYKTNIIIPYSYWKANEATTSVIIVTDIWGNSKSLKWDN